MVDPVECLCEINSTQGGIKTRLLNSFQDGVDKINQVMGSRAIRHVPILFDINTWREIFQIPVSQKFFKDLTKELRKTNWS